MPIVQKPVRTSTATVEVPRITSVVHATPGDTGLEGALAYWTADEGVNTTNNPYATSWDAELYDTGSHWSVGAADRFVGLSTSDRYQFAANVSIDWGNDGDSAGMLLRHYNSSDVLQETIGNNRTTGSNQNPGTSQTTPRALSRWITPGASDDYFLAQAQWSGFQSNSNMQLISSTSSMSLISYSSYTALLDVVKVCQVELSGNQTLAVGSDDKIDFDTVVVDADSMWNSGSARVDIPADGYARVSLCARIEHSTDVARWKTLRVYKNGSGAFVGCHEIVTGGVSSEFARGLALQTAWVPVSSGDYFEAYAGCESALGTETCYADVTLMTVEFVADGDLGTSQETYVGATMTLTSTPSAFTADTWTDVTYSSVVEDSSGSSIADAGAGTWTVPAGVSEVELRGDIYFQGAFTHWVRVLKNGTEVKGQRGGSQAINGNVRTDLVGPRFSVSEGDVIKVQVWSELTNGGTDSGTKIEACFFT